MTLGPSLLAARALLEELAAACPGTTAASKVPAALADLAAVEVVAAKYRDTETRLDSVAETLFGLASLDFTRRTVVVGDGGVLDGVVGCINMLGEELASYVEERGRIERDLERRVAERTRELTRMNQELTHEIAERQRAAQDLGHSRAELVQANLALQSEMQERQQIEGELRLAQKLEAVGRLASGVAHEINTPVQFVSDSVQFVKEAMADLARVIATLGAVTRSIVDGAPSQLAAAQALATQDEAELDYLLEQVPLALDRALDGLSQVTSIVRSMKAFAHPDASQMSSVDLNRAIESTLVMARSEYKLVADVATDFGELPPITCHPGEVNQVVLNIVVNAAHAIGDVVKTSGAKGCITIRTRREGEHVLVAISDTGTGIPENIRARIFDPFFTTKELGRGTGQGLALVHRIIVDKHAGAVNVNSVVGHGTTFELRLPIEGAMHATRRASAR